MNRPTRITGRVSSSPCAVMTFAGKRTTFADSVISRCNSNHRRSSSSIDASLLDCPIFFARSVRNSSRSLNWICVNELSNWPRASPAACCNTPNSSFRLPSRSRSCFSSAASFFSFSSNSFSSRALRFSWRTCSAFISASFFFWLALSALNARMRAAFSCASLTRPVCTCFSNSSRLTGPAAAGKPVIKDASNRMPVSSRLFICPPPVLLQPVSPSDPAQPVCVQCVFPARPVVCNPPLAVQPTFTLAHPRRRSRPCRYSGTATPPVQRAKNRLRGCGRQT